MRVAAGLSKDTFSRAGLHIHVRFVNVDYLIIRLALTMIS